MRVADRDNDKSQGADPMPAVIRSSLANRTQLVRAQAEQQHYDPVWDAVRTKCALGLLALSMTLAYLACSASAASADVNMSGRLEPVHHGLSSGLTSPISGGITPLATSANGTYRCADEYSVVANWYYYFAIGNCPAGAELEVVSYASENTVTHEHSYGGFVNGAFSGCGWINTAYPIEKENSNSHSACAGSGSGREFKVAESSFMEKYNEDGHVGEGNPVINKKPCPEYANYRPWSESNVEKELIRTAPEYAASGPGSNYPALKWRYVTKYASTDKTGKYVMVEDDRITGAGAGNWVFVPLSCLRSSPSELPTTAGERLPPAATVTTEGSSNVLTTSATLSGSVDPNEVDTHYYIEWGREASNPTEAFAPTPYPGEDLGSGNKTLTRSVEATGLQPNTTYYYRIVAKSARGTIEGGNVSFQTLALPPEVTTTAASHVGETEATLNGTVNPKGLDTHYHFEYGTTGWTSTPEGDAGSGSSTLSESATVTGLVANTTYHYRLTAVNTQGATGAGTEGTFRTLGAPGPRPSVTRDAKTDREWIYYRGTNGAIFQLYFDGSGWDSPQEFAGTAVAVNSNPVAVREPATGHEWVYYQGTSGAIYQLYFSGEAWSPPQEFAGTHAAPETSPVVTHDATTQQEWVYYQGSNGAIYQLYFSGKAWSPPGEFAGTHAAPGSSRAAIHEPGTDQEWVYYQGSSGAIYQLYFSGKAWSPPGEFAGTHAGEGASPAAIREPSTTQEWVYYQGNGGAGVWELYFTGGAWDGPNRFAGT